jgi:hypothetical protein
MKKAALAQISVLLITLMLVAPFPFLKAVSETPPIQWQQFFNGNRGYSVLQTKDEGYAVTGINASTSLLVRTDSIGNLMWVKAYQIGGNETNLPYLVQTRDGGYALGGTWENKFALVKVDFEGGTQWIKTYEYPALFNYLHSFIQTRDGGYALVGTFSPPQNITHNIGQVFFVKVDALGNMQWNKTIVGPLGNFANSVFETTDGGYVIIGTSWASDLLPSNFKVIKTNSVGDVQWDRIYGGEGKFFTAESESGIITKDGGYMLAGVSLEEGQANAWHAWLVKTDSQGNMMWNKTYGGTGSWAFQVVQTQDGGYAFAGALNGKDAWVLKTDSNGNADWNLTPAGVTFVGSSVEDFGKCIIQTNDGGYALVGTKDGEIWLAKISPSASPASVCFPTEMVVIVVAAIIVIVIAPIIIRKLRKRQHLLTH